MKPFFPRNILHALLLLIVCMVIVSPVVFITDDSILLHLLIHIIIWCSFYFVNFKNGHRIKYSFTNDWNSPLLFLAALFVVAFQVGVNHPMVDYLGHALGLIKEGSETTTAPLYAAVIAGPILEELVFRGGILHAFLNNMNRIRAVLLSSLLFAAIHLLPHQMIGAFALGVLFGIVYSRTRNLGHTIVLHIIANAMGMCTNHIYGHSAPHNSLHIFLPALAATIVITVLLVKQLRSTPVPTNL